MRLYLFLGAAEFLKSRLKEYGLITPISTDSEGHYLSHLLSANHKHRVKRDAAPTTAAGSEGGPEPESGERLFFNVTAFGKEFHLRLYPNRKLVAPGAMVEWHDQVETVLEDNGNSTTTTTTRGAPGNRTSSSIRTDRILNRELLKTDCTFVGDITDVPGASVAINNCDGLVSCPAMKRMCCKVKCGKCAVYWIPHLAGALETDDPVAKDADEKNC